MEGMNAIFQGINALSAMESRQKQNQIADFQLQEAQRVNAEKAALSKNYDAMAQAFQQNGGNLDALAPSESLEAASRSLLRTIRARVEEVYSHDRWEILDVTRDLREQRATWNREIKKQRRKTG